jgi:beta-lactamase regulating signal transducer with metallopeptidase domain
MDTFVSWLIRSALISGLMLAYYHGVLRNRKLHAFNRVWLLTALLASLVLPLIPVNFLTWHSAAPPQVITTLEAHPAGAKAFPVMTIVLIAGAVVSALLLSILVIRIWRVYRLKRHHHVQRLEGCMLIEIQDRRAPFSFLKNLFWKEGADIHDPFHRKILDHELAHIRGGHTLDILLAQTLSAVFWMNPFYWLIRRELFMVHEFIADDASIAAGDTETFAWMLLQAYDDGRYLDPSHHFFHSPIKRRLLMISSSKSPSRWRMAMALPILLAVMALACSKEQSAPAPITKPLSLTLAKITRDSIQVAFAPALKRVLINGIAKANKTDQVAHITLDTLGMKVQMDVSPGAEVTGTNDRKPPPPPPPPAKY